MNAALRDASLEDKYATTSGTVLASGTQMLVRLLLEQRALDAARGWNTAGYVSGYRGSPLGGLDQQLWRASRHLETAGIIFQPGVNEDLAATAIWGTQQAPLLPGAKYEGVFALWYGKGPGLDRSGDPIKHGNRMGASHRGGVLLAVGDDHAGKSSTTAYQSEQMLAANDIPILYPATVQEYLDFGLAGWALSRHSGLWVGMKCVNETVETTATVEVGSNRIRLVEPEAVGPSEGVNARIAFDPVGDDVRLHRYRLPAALAFARANALDRVAIGGDAQARLAIIAAGKSYLDTLAALRELGVDRAAASAIGIRLYKPGLIWPLEPQRLREAARGCAEVLVIEEKAAFLEPQIAHALFNLPARERPRLIGKQDETGRVLLASDVPLDTGAIASTIAARLTALGIADAGVAKRAESIALRRQENERRRPSPVSRPPYFCSGCPHNTSTRVPEGSLALAGIGCHTMAMGMERSTLPPTQMGGEGMTWAGAAPFTSMRHVFQNLGDGTYFHSGLLAIRGAVAAGVNVTYKILVNDAVAMTGGQPVEGSLSIAEISHQLAAERVHRIAVVSDVPERWRRQRKQFAPGTTFHSRDALELVQRELREISGVTAILYEQTCAAEKRRRRKRAALPQPQRRAFIHEKVCEGCGDCSVKSNCVSVEPLETPLGRKRRIDQSSCNVDLSCIKGFCPSFVLVEGGRPHKPARAALDPMVFSSIPDPPSVPAMPFNALIAGVGGTGIVTIGAVLAMAAHLEGKRAGVFDMTGLAQKGGAVVSHLRIGAGAQGDPLDRQGDAPAAIGAGETDLLIAGDLVVGAGADVLRTVDATRTRLVLNSHFTPVSQFQRNRDFDFHQQELLQRLHSAAPERALAIDASGIAVRLLGDAIAANMIVAGVAYQDGTLPIGAAAIERAIELNGTAVESNLAAFRIGRLLRHDPQSVARMCGDVLPHDTIGRGESGQAEQPASFDATIDGRAALLQAYQDSAYADRYRALVRLVRATEQTTCGSESLAMAVARNYAKLLAYKDEYEVARLYCEPSFRQTLAREFDGDFRIRILLAPPLLARRDPVSGEPRKMALGAWILPVFRVLAAARRLRGTAFDPFGYTAERRLERRLIVDYEHSIAEVLTALRPETHAMALEIASIPDSIRGFGHVKRRSIEAAQARWSELLQRWCTT